MPEKKPEESSSTEILKKTPPPPMDREEFHRLMVFDAELRKVNNGVGVIDLKALSLMANYQNDYRCIE